MRIASLILLSSSLLACAVDGDDATQGGNGKADGNGSCAVPEYGDGTCQIDLACDVPDVDCYTTFDTDEAATAWIATQQLPYPTVATTDPRVMRARPIVDRAFELFKSRVQLGTLADKRLSIVVLEGEANAFIIDDYMTHKGAWSVQIMTGLLDASYSDDQILGVLEHEFTHLAKLHFIQEVDERLRKFYLAPDGKEPIGEATPEHAIAKEHGAEWRKSAALVGPFTNPELGDFPLSGSLGEIFADYVTYTLAAPCNAQATGFAAQYNALAHAISKLDSSLKIEPSTAPQLKAALDSVLQCGVVDPQTLRGYLDAASPEWVPYLQPMMSADEIALLDKPILTSIVSIVHSRREQMRTAETKLASETGRPWNALRFYSYEEQADDNSVRILRSAGIDAFANAKTEFLSYLDEMAPVCEQALAAGTPGYGSNYFDEHHATCWRIAHAGQIAAQGTTARMTHEDDDAARVAHEPVHKPRRPGPHPIY
jgi:hypothetical protein